MPSSLVPVVLVLAAVSVVWGLLVREAQARRFRQALDERPLQVQVTAPPAVAPVRSLEDRLAELDDLHHRGLISDEEHRAARARTLGDG